MGRVLGVPRLSRDTDESTSIERQQDTIRQHADTHNDEIVGWAIDVDVSREVAPWLRPELGQWLPSTIGQTVSKEAERWACDQSRAGEWDTLVVWRMDRITGGSMIHVYQLIEWCQKNGKRIRSATEPFDTDDPLSEILIGMLASFARAELKAIKRRCKDSAAHLLKTGRWRGGTVPYGYRPVKLDGPGYGIEPCPETSPVVMGMVQRVIGGQSVNSITTWLNENGVATPQNAALIRAGKPTLDGKQWSHTTVNAILRSRALLGQIEVTDKIVTNGKTKRVTKILRDDSGNPVQRSEPLVSQDDYDTLQETLDQSSQGKAPQRPYDASLLLHVAHCECGSPMYASSVGTLKYYRCARYLECGNRRVRQDRLDEYLSSVFLILAGELSVTRKVFVPGSDHLEQLDSAKRAMNELMEEKAGGLYSSKHGRQQFVTMYSQLERTVSELECLPVVEGRWEDEETEETYSSRWERFDTAERNQLLSDAGIRVTVARDNVPSPEPGEDDELLAEGVGSQAHRVPDDGAERGMHIGTGRVVVFVPPDLKDRINSRTPGVWDRVSAISQDMNGASK